MYFSSICLLLLQLSRLHLSQCTTFFPANSAFGLFAAIAVPLDLPHYNCFVSYNFEANYNLPRTWGIPPALILAAIAVPLDLPNRNVFFSYNFEANYNLPSTWGIPPFAAGIEDEDLFESEVRQLQECTNCTAPYATTTSTPTPFNSTKGTTKSSRFKKPKIPKENRERRSLLTRTHFYEILKHKFEMSGYKGESCLLRLICESNASSLGEMNGVLGSLVHILFAPSSSMNEQLPLHFYQAELDGAHEQCEHYAADCTENILDLISTPLHEIINELAK